MQSVEKIKAALDFHREELKEAFKVKEIGISSSSSGREQNEKSYVDALVTFSETIDLFTFVELENYLSDILGVRVGLAMKENIKPRLNEEF